MTSSIARSIVKGIFLLFAFVLMPLACYGYLQGDINGDDKISLVETIYSLRAAAGIVIPLSGTTINVPADIPTIQQAINAASDGDSINIAAGIYTEALAINGKTLTLSGAGSGATYINGATANVISITDSPGVSIRNLTIQNGNIGVSMVKASAQISNAIVNSCSSAGINMYEKAVAEVTNSTIEGNGGDGVLLLGGSDITFFGGITIQNNGRSGLRLFLGSKAVLSDSSTFVSSGNGDSGIKGEQNTSLFVGTSTVTLNNNVHGMSSQSSSTAVFTGDATVTVSDNSQYGMVIQGASRLLSYGDITIQGSGNTGLYVSETSNLSVGGPVLIKECGNSGLFINLASSAYVSERLEILDCIQAGINLSRGSSLMNTDTANIIVKNSQLPDGVGVDVAENSIWRAQGGTILIDSNKGYGLGVGRNATISFRSRGTGLNATITNNVGSGILAYQQGSIRTDTAMSITGNAGDGINLNGGSECQLNGINIQNNSGWGITADRGSGMAIGSAIIQSNTAGDVRLQFGSWSDLNGNTIGSPLNCDSTVLSRGSAVCP